MRFTIGDDLRAISLWQPWATLIAIGHKKIETRPWSTDYRGWLAIHATKGESKAEQEAMTLCFKSPFFGSLTVAGINDIGKLPHSSIVALARLVAVESTLVLGRHVSPLERAFGNYKPGRYGFLLEDIQRLPRPVPCAGNQQLWIPPDLVRQEIAQQIAECCAA